MREVHKKAKEGALERERDDKSSDSGNSSRPDQNIDYYSVGYRMGQLARQKVEQGEITEDEAKDLHTLSLYLDSQEISEPRIDKDLFRCVDGYREGLGSF